MLLFPGLGSRFAVRRKALLKYLWFGGVFFGAGLLSASAREKWQNATPAELAGTAPTLEADAAAEALLWKIEVDDTNFPESRRVDEYVRYKVFDPQRADRLMRLSQELVSYDGTELKNGEMSARLTLPDGTSKEFGAESIKERTVLKKAGGDSLVQRIFGSDGLEVKEKFLAIGTVQPGSIVEVRTSVTEHYPRLASFRLLQFEEVPVLKLEYVHNPVSEEGFNRTLSIFNTQLLQWKENKRTGEINVWGGNLPSIKHEPFDGARSYYAATVVLSYTRRHLISMKGTDQRRHFRADQPWAPIATVQNWEAEDRITVTRKVKKTAAELVADAGNDLEQAQHIHDYVQGLFARYVRQEKKNRVVMMRLTDRVSMDDVIDFESAKPEQLLAPDFLWLAASLYRAAGFRAEILMLPSQRIAPFTRRIASQALLQELCVAVRIGDSWHFSLPNSRQPRAFDELPAENQGYGGLLALDNQEEFIDIPFSPASQSRIENVGTLRLESGGTLSGNCRIKFTGHEAASMRQRLYGRNPERQIAIAKRSLGRQFAPAELSGIQIENIDDPRKPLELSFALRWLEYATVTDNRLIFRPFVFRANEHPPFASAERHNAIYFPFRNEEADTLVLALPDGYELEAKEVPPSSPGAVLAYKIQIGYNRTKHALHIQRDFMSSLISANVTDYPALKRWYDMVATSDQYSLVLKKSAAPAPTPASPPAP